MKKASSYKAPYIAFSSCILLAILLLPALSFGQVRGKVEVIKDPLIDTFIARRPQLSKFRSGGEESSFGYRVQIFFGSNRQAAYNAQARFTDEHPDTRTYITYAEPNFKVQVGDFRTRLEAQKLISEISQAFSSIFIIPQKINPPKTDQSND